MENTKKKEILLALKQIVDMPKISVLGHESLNIFSEVEPPNHLLGWNVPSNATDIVVIYLKKQ